MRELIDTFQTLDCPYDRISKQRKNDNFLLYMVRLRHYSVAPSCQDFHYSLDSEDGFCSGHQEISHQQQFFWYRPSLRRLHYMNNIFLEVTYKTSRSLHNFSQINSKKYLRAIQLWIRLRTIEVKCLAKKRRGLLQSCDYGISILNKKRIWIHEYHSCWYEPEIMDGLILLEVVSNMGNPEARTVKW